MNENQYREICIEPERILEELNKGLGKGPLTLEIVCTKCESRFELNRESVALSIMTGMTFIEYLRWIQESSCASCENKNE